MLLRCLILLTLVQNLWAEPHFATAVKYGLRRQLDNISPTAAPMNAPDESPPDDHGGEGAAAKDHGGDGVHGGDAHEKEGGADGQGGETTGSGNNGDGDDDDDDEGDDDDDDDDDDDGSNGNGSSSNNDESGSNDGANTEGGSSGNTEDTDEDSVVDEQESGSNDTGFTTTSSLLSTNSNASSSRLNTGLFVGLAAAGLIAALTMSALYLRNSPATATDAKSHPLKSAVKKRMSMFSQMAKHHDKASRPDRVTEDDKYTLFDDEPVGDA